MTNLDPGARKRPTFEDGVPITLSDGNEWVFPLPKVGGYYYPSAGKDGKLAFVQAFDRGREYDALTDRYCEAGDDSAADRYLVLVEIAFFLLKQNYEVELSDMAALLQLQIGRGDEVRANREMWEKLGEVALGTGPKPTAVGGPPASPPTA
jgi:hypothetical protein